MVCFETKPVWKTLDDLKSDFYTYLLRIAYIHFQTESSELQKFNFDFFENQL